jgi:hypothetical protein
MAKKFTDVGMRALRPRAKRYEKPAGNGLYVIVQPTGRRAMRCAIVTPAGPAS